MPRGAGWPLTQRWACAESRIMESHVDCVNCPKMQSRYMLSAPDMASRYCFDCPYSLVRRRFAARVRRDADGHTVVHSCRTAVIDP